MISDERAEKALGYLVDTDDKCAMAQSHFEALHSLRHQAEGYSVKEKGKSRDEGTFESFVSKVEEARHYYLTMKNKRTTEALVIEMYRTVSANQRKGNI